MAYNNACIIFMLFFLIKCSKSSCLPYDPYKENSKDVYNIFSEKGPILYTYNFEHKPEFRYPIEGNQSCLFYTSYQRKLPRLSFTCAKRGQSLCINSYPIDGLLGTTFLTEPKPGIILGYDLHRVGAVSQSDIYSLTCTASPHHFLNFFPTKHVSFTIYNVGFVINAGQVLPVYKIVDFTIYNKHLIGHVKIVSVIKSRPTFPKSIKYKQGDKVYENKINFTQMYDKKYQEKQFLDSIGDSAMTRKYFSDNYLAIGQLVNKDDLFYYAQQMSTYYYENTIPVWDSIIKGNWDLINNIIRDMADETEEDLEVFTYPFDIFEKHGKSVYFYHIGVPRLLVKVVYFSANPTQGIVFHTANDPYVTKDEMLVIMNGLCSSDHYCHNDYPEFLDAKRGLTLCCALEDSKIFLKLKNNIIKKI